MRRVALPTLDTMLKVVEELENAGIRVTAKKLAAKTGWSINSCAYGLHWMGKSPSRGRPPVDYEDVKRRVASVIAGFLLDQTPLDVNRVVAATGATRHAVTKAMRDLGLRVCKRNHAS